MPMMSLMKIRMIAKLASVDRTEESIELEPSEELSSFSMGVHSQKSKAHSVVQVDSLFEVGRLVQAWSRTEKRWLPAEVLEVDSEDSMIKIKPTPVLTGARVWEHPRGVTPYIDGFDRSAIRPVPKDEDRIEGEDQRIIGEEWSFASTFDDVKACKKEIRGWGKVRAIFAPDVVLPGMTNANMSASNIIEHMFVMKTGFRQTVEVSPGTRRAQDIIAKAKANRQLAIERRM